MKGFLLSNPYGGLLLSLGAFWLGCWLHKKTGKAALQPILSSSLLIILLLLFLGISYGDYKAQNQLLVYCLPVTAVVLALPLYRNLDYLKKNFLPLFLGSFIGTLASMGLLVLLGRLMGVDRQLLISMLPKSSTAAIALDLSEKIGGAASLTMVMVVLAGNLGAIFGPQFLRACGIKDDKAIGLALGCMSHAAGTARAFGESQEAGTMSSLAMVLGGIFTALLSPLVVLFFF